MSWLEKFFGAKDIDYPSMDITQTSQEDRVKTEESFSSQTQIPVMKSRKFSFGYSKSYAMSKTKCPRCEKELRQEYAQVLYATDKKPALQLTAEVYSCVECPTVVLDTKKIEKSLPDNQSLSSVLAIMTSDAQGKKNTFELWDDKQTRYITDANKTITGMQLLQPGEKVQEEPEKTEGKRKVLNEAQLKQVKKNKRIARQTRRANRKK